MMILQGKRLFAILPLLCGLASPAQDGSLHTAREVNEFLERGHGRTNFVLSVQLICDPAGPAVFVPRRSFR